MFIAVERLWSQSWSEYPIFGVLQLWSWKITWFVIMIMKNFILFGLPLHFMNTITNLVQILWCDHKIRLNISTPSLWKHNLFILNLFLINHILLEIYLSIISNGKSFTPKFHVNIKLWYKKNKNQAQLKRSNLWKMCFSFITWKCCNFFHYLLIFRK